MTSCVVCVVLTIEVVILFGVPAVLTGWVVISSVGLSGRLVVLCETVFD